MKSKTFISFLRASTQKYEEKIAIVDLRGEYTYKELWKQISIIGTLLIKLGIIKGDRVFLQIINSYEFVVFFYGILYAGGIVCPLDENLSSPNCLIQIHNLNPKIIILSRRNFDRHRKYLPLYNLFSSLDHCIIINNQNNLNHVDTDLPNSIDSELFWKLEKDSPVTQPCPVNDSDLAQIVHTTGTTDIQKPVMLTHAQIVKGCEKIINIANITRDDIEVTTLPLVRLFGQFHLHTYLQVGGTMIIEPNILNYKRTLDKVLAYNATSFPQVISAFNMIMEDAQELFRKCDKTLRYVMLCSMQASHNQLIRLQNHLPTTDIYNTYGLSEAVRCTYVNITREPNKIDSVGKPNIGVKIEIIDENNKILSPMQKGEIVVTSDHMFSGYWKNESSTSKAIINGKLMTGDIGYLDNDGYLYYVSRKSDEINVGGKKFLPKEIEDIVSNHFTEFEEVIVIPIPDPENILGTIPFMFIKVNKNKRISKRFVQRFLTDYVESFKIPRYIEYIEQIPRSASGKILKHSLLMIAKDKLVTSYGHS